MKEQIREIGDHLQRTGEFFKQTQQDLYHTNIEQIQNITEVNKKL